MIDLFCMANYLIISKKWSFSVFPSFTQFDYRMVKLKYANDNFNPTLFYGKDIWPPLGFSRDAGLAFFSLRDSGLPQYLARDTGFNLAAVSGFEKKFKRDTGFGLYPVRDSGLKTFQATICYALFQQNGCK